MSIWTHVHCKVRFMLTQGETLEPDKDFGKSLKLKWEVVDENNYTPREVSREGGWAKWKKNHKSRKERDAMDDRYWAEHRKRQKRNIKWAWSEEFYKEMDKRWGEYKADPNSYMPVGSEGGCEIKIYKAKTKLGEFVYTVNISGHLRNYETEEVPLQYFKDKIIKLADKTQMIDARVTSSCMQWQRWEYKDSSYDYEKKYRKR